MICHTSDFSSLSESADGGLSGLPTWAAAPPCGPPAFLELSHLRHIVLFIISSIRSIYSEAYSCMSYSLYLHHLHLFFSFTCHTTPNHFFRSTNHRRGLGARWPRHGPGSEPLGGVAVVPATFSFRSWTFARSQVPMGWSDDPDSLTWM